MPKRLGASRVMKKSAGARKVVRLPWKAVGSSPFWGALPIYSPLRGFVNMVCKYFPQFGEIAEITQAELYNHHKGSGELNRIKELRLSKGMKQSDLARLLKCAPTAVSKYELGQLDISSATILRLCDIFGCTADYLLARSGNPSPVVSDEDAALLAAFDADDTDD